MGIRDLGGVGGGLLDEEDIEDSPGEEA